MTVPHYNNRYNQIARGLINDPEIIFMDEPTVGPDPIGAKMLRGIIVRMKEQGRTVLLTTHYLYEADELCDRIAIINHGKLIALDTTENLKCKYATMEHQSLEDVYIKLIEESEGKIKEEKP